LLRAYAPAPNQQQDFNRKNTVNEKGLALNEKKVFLQRNFKKPMTTIINDDTF